MHALDENYGFYRQKYINLFTKSTFLSVKYLMFIRCIRDLRHFKAVVLPFLKYTIMFL